MGDIAHFKSTDEIAWCPGCGNFGILLALKKALVVLNKEPKDVLLCSGIGQAAKTPHYIKCNCFNGLHGRSIPVAAAAKMANHKLTVIVTTGDGDCYGEGGNHLIHNIRRNVDITVIVHNNQIYGLTKGQASPMTDRGFTTKVQTHGVMLEPFHSLAVAIILGAKFVARGFSNSQDELTDLIVQGVNHRGFSLIEVLQPCVSFNKKNTAQWYAERIYRLADEASYDPANRLQAVEKALEWGERIPLGVFFRGEGKTYNELTGLTERPPLCETAIEHIDIAAALAEFAA
ncbi:MAG: 2-oxoacid ferredoxin oxidoreductase [Candidatus Omnitrophica bacterium]|nr:2-oxoacid ferredoxin oxidoreductase [Candidatus Omnitrophota bacterium]